MKLFITLTAACFLGFAALPASQNQEVKAQNPDKTDQHAAKTSRDKPALKKQLDANRANNPKGNDKQGTANHAENEADFLTRLVAWANLGMLALGMVGLWFVYKQLRATGKSNEHTEESNRIARESAEFGQRAWLAIVEVSGTTCGTDESLTIVYKNTGNMPAVNITFSAVGQIHRDIFEEYGGRRLTEAEAAEKPGIVVTSTGSRISSERCLGNGERGEYSILAITPDCIKDPHPGVVIEVTARYFDIFQKERTTVSQHRIYSPAVREWVTITVKMT